MHTSMHHVPETRAYNKVYLYPESCRRVAVHASRGGRLELEPSSRRLLGRGPVAALQGKHIGDERMQPQRTLG